MVTILRRAGIFLLILYFTAVTQAQSVPRVIDDFESGLVIGKVVRDTSGYHTAIAGWRMKGNAKIRIDTVSVSSTEGKVNRVLRVDYDLNEKSYSWFRLNFEQPLDLSNMEKVSFRVKGDGSGNRLTLRLSILNLGGKEKVVTSGGVILNFEDWRLIEIPLQVPVKYKDKVDQIIFVISAVEGKGLSPSTIMIDDIMLSPQPVTGPANIEIEPLPFHKKPGGAK